MLKLERAMPKKVRIYNVGNGKGKKIKQNYSIPFCLKDMKMISPAQRVYDTLHQR